jgi:hypothetical protein
MPAKAKSGNWGARRARETEGSQGEQVRGRPTMSDDDGKAWSERLKKANKRHDEQMSDVPYLSSLYAKPYTEINTKDGTSREDPVGEGVPRQLRRDVYFKNPDPWLIPYVPSDVMKAIARDCRASLDAARRRSSDGRLDAPSDSRRLGHLWLRRDLGLARTGDRAGCDGRARPVDDEGNVTGPLLSRKRRARTSRKSTSRLRTIASTRTAATGSALGLQMDRAHLHAFARRHDR